MIESQTAFTKREAQMETISINSNFLIDFINLRPLTFETVEGFYKRHGLTHYNIVADGIDIPSNSYCAPATSSYLYLFNELILNRTKVKNPFPGKAKLEHSTLVPPSDYGSSLLFKDIKELQHEYRDFIDDCIRGNLDIAFINERITFLGFELGTARLYFEKGSKQWNPSVYIVTYEFTLKKWLDVMIIQTLLSGEGESFSKVKRCLHCGDYFTLKSKKAKFCSDKCRMAYHQESKAAE